jgi:hypothetical protein
LARARRPTRLVHRGAFVLQAVAVPLPSARSRTKASETD